MGDRMPGRAQLGDKSADPGIGGLQRADVEQLASDVNRHAAQVEAVEHRKSREDSGGLVDRHAELVLALAGRDLGMGAGIDVRIDAQHGARLRAACRGELRENDAFFFQFDVELPDPSLDPAHQLRTSLADAGEDDVRRRHTGGERPRHLAARDYVGAITLAREHVEDSDVWVRLDRIGEVDTPGRFQPVPEGARLVPQLICGIDIDRRAHLRRDARKGNGFAVKLAIDQLKMVHRYLGGRSNSSLRRSSELRSSSSLRPGRA